MFGEDKTITLIKDKLYRIGNELNSEIQICMLNEREKANANGNGNSGMFIALLNSIIQNKINSSCKSFLLYIEDMQRELNIIYSNKQIKNIKRYIKEKYENIAKRIFDKLIADLPNTKDPMTSQLESWKNGLISNIANIVESDIKEIHLKNQLRKDNKALIEAKRANFIAAGSFIIALIAVAISYYKK